MAVTSQNILLVEAQGDKDFIECFIKEERKSDINFLTNLDIQVAIPSDVDEFAYTCKDDVLKSLQTLARGFDDGRVTRLGIIMDMDSEKGDTDVLSYNIKLIKEKLDSKMTLKTEPSYKNGLFFKDEAEDFQPIGVWLMPNNNDEGYLETWIESCIADKEASYFNKAEQFIESFEEGYFQKVGITKGKVYTWLAIQKKPRNDLRQAIQKKIIDTQADNYQNFKQWLIATFAD